MFALTAAFMRHAVRPDFSIFEITGGASPAPGEPLLLRVAARLHDANTSLPVKVDAVTTGDGAPLPLSVRGENPALLETLAAEALRLHLSGPRPVTLAVPPAPPARPEPPPPPEPATRLGDLFIELVPMGGELVAGLQNRVFLRLRDADQRPPPPTRVTLTHRNLPNGRVDLMTDRDGLAELTLNADRPNLDLEVALTGGDPGAQATVALRPLGRELTMTVPPRAPPGGRLAVEVETLRTRGLLSCELLHESSRGPVWVSALDHPLTSRRFAIEVPLPNLPEGTRLDLQCALVPGVGLAWASRPVWLGPPSERLSDALAQTREATPRQPPRVLLRTRDADREAFEHEHGKTRTLLFVALVCVLSALLLLALSRILIHTRRTRALLDAALSEDPTLTSPERRDITRTRGLFYLLVGLSLAIGWITAVAALLA